MNDRDDTNTRRDGEEPQAPPRLVAALKELPARRVFVPPSVDDAILRAARERLARPRRARFGRVPPWIAWPAFAAACLVVLGMIYLIVRPANRLQSFAAADLNRDGEVNILDAFQLARELPGIEQGEIGSDVNGDGRVDGADVDRVAAEAVKLEKGGRS